jgi:hypothetical protein
MRKIFILSVFIVACVCAQAQCSVCTKTAQQMGEKPAKGMNSGILYLMAMPFVVSLFVGYKWWKYNRETTEETPI